MAGSGVVAQAAVKFGHRSAEQKHLFGHLVHSVKFRVLSSDPCAREARASAAAGFVVLGRVAKISVVKFRTHTSDQGDGSFQDHR